MDARDDLAARLARIERQIAALRDDLRALARRLDAVERQGSRSGRPCRPDRRETGED